MIGKTGNSTRCFVRPVLECKLAIEHLKNQFIHWHMMDSRTDLFDSLYDRVLRQTNIRDWLLESMSHLNLHTCQIDIIRIARLSIFDKMGI